MSFRRMLSGGFAALIFITLATGTVSVVALRQASLTHEEITRDFAADLLAVERLRSDGEELATTSRGHALTRDPHLLARLQDSARKFDQRLAELRERPLDRTAAGSIRKIEAVAREWEAISTSATTEPDQLLTSFGRLEQYLTEFVEHEETNFDQTLEQARSSATQHEIAVALATLLGIVLSGVLATLVVRRLDAHFRREQAASAAARREAAARQEILAVVSHDLRNPLSSITMGAALLAEILPPDPISIGKPAVRGPQRHVQAVANAAQRMTAMIEGILDTARIEAGTFKLHCATCDLVPLIDSTIELFQLRSNGRNIKIRSEPIAADVSVMVDRERVHQVLSNLIANALKFTPEGGEITVVARVEPALVTIEVRDTGPGIAVEQRTRVFERYWQGEGAKQQGSLGLGLYICKTIVEAHEGRIWVDSAVGQGARFCFTLPRTAAATA